MAWDTARASLSLGQSVDCEVTSVHPFGVLVAICTPERPDGLIHRTDLPSHADPMPRVGARLSARVIGFQDRFEQVVLSMLPPLDSARQSSP